MERILRFRFIGFAIIGLSVSLACFLAWKVFSNYPTHWNLDSQFLLFFVAGFTAQLIDGALGMAYGVSCSTLLLSFGVPPALTSASIHIAEVFSTGTSGLSHLLFKNVNKKLFLKLLIPGLFGAVLGAYLISEIFDANLIKPYVSAYLLILGVILLYKGLRKYRYQRAPSQKNISSLGFFGGLLDAIGGGGWGPIVTSNLIHKGNCPRASIGTVNTVEFFVTLSSTVVFLAFVTITTWEPILGLIFGGVLAAPLGAWVVSFLKPQSIMVTIGILVILTSFYTFIKALGLSPI